MDVGCHFYKGDEAPRGRGSRIFHRWALSFLSAFLVVTCVGCATSHAGKGVGHRIGQYFVNRGLDALNIVDLSLGAGPIMRVDVQYGLGNVGFGWVHSYRLRIGGGSPATKEEAYEFSLLPPPLPQGLVLIDSAIGGDTSSLMWGIGFTKESEQWILPYCVSASERPEMERGWYAFLSVQDGPQVDANSTAKERIRWASAAIGAEVHILVGLRARIYPVQLVHFVGGIFGLHLLHDDLE